MKILSVNIGQPAVLDFDGKQQTSAFIKTAVTGPVSVWTRGLEGDVRVAAIHSKPDSAVYALSQEMYSGFFSQIDFPTQDKGSFGENLSMDKLDESKICVGDHFSVGSALLQATGPRIPCNSLNFRFKNKNAMKAFAALRRPGVYFRVIQEGQLRAGDSLVFQESTETLRISMMDIWSFLMDKKMDLATAENWLTVRSHNPQVIKKLKLFTENI